MAQGIALAVLGAAGLNGENLLGLLAESGLAYKSLLLVDEDAFLGRKLEVGDKLLPLSSYAQVDFQEIDLVIACEPIPAELVSQIGEQGASLIAPQACLADALTEPVIAGVNLERQDLYKGMALGVPNAQATVLARLLAPLQDELGLIGVQASWTRAVSLDGRGAIETLAGETAQLLNGKKPKPSFYAEPLAFNLLGLDAAAEEAEFRQLWFQLWGDDRLHLSINTVLAPLFFGDIVSLSVETEQPTGVAELAELLCSAGGCETLEGAEKLLSAAQTKETASIYLAQLRQMDTEGRRFTGLLALDSGRAGLARNFLEIADNLVKKLFISYS
ncbi:MAG: hypothetical protein HQL47_06335 [Gammaproteobacteria bacterium]|nr:hypothetical protein [Gammaproteobacteria bacterium]